LDFYLYKPIKTKEMKEEELMLKALVYNKYIV